MSVNVSVFKTFIGVVVACVLFPAAASAQSLWWSENGNSFTSFGPNSGVVIYQGTITGGTCDPIFPTTDIYVVNVSSLSQDQKIIDVSNASGPNGTGLPNTVQTGGSRVFIDEVIGITQPSGFLGAGVYGVVYDECQNGTFDVGEDTLFYPAFEVVIPANIPLLPNASFQAMKDAAEAEGNSWAFLLGMDLRF